MRDRELQDCIDEAKETLVENLDGPIDEEAK